MNRRRPLILGGLLLALPFSVAAAKNVKPDPNGLPPHVVQDLQYGDVLFYFFQDDYFDSITRLLAAREQNRIPHTEGEAELLLGGLYLSLGQHVEAGRIFEALLKQNTSEAVRNRAWFYLGKVWYQRGYLEESERALRQVSDKMDPRIDAERYMLIAQLMMKQGRYDDAIAALSNWHGAPDWTAYAQFNLGVALVRKERLTEAARYLDRVGTMQTRSPELLALKDKANLALGFALLQAQRAAEAKPILQRIRLEGIQLLTHVGVYASEKRAAQPVWIDIELDAELVFQRGAGRRAKFERGHYFSDRVVVSDLVAVVFARVDLRHQSVFVDREQHD